MSCIKIPLFLFVQWTERGRSGATGENAMWNVATVSGRGIAHVRGRVGDGAAVPRQRNEPGGLLRSVYWYIVSDIYHFFCLLSSSFNLDQ